MAENTAGDSAELSVVLSRIADKADTAMTQVAALIDSLEQRAERAEGERDGWKLEAERLDELNKSANASNAFKSAQVDRIVIEEAAATKAARDATKAVKAELAIATAQVESLAASLRQVEAERDELAQLCKHYADDAARKART